MVLCPDGQGNRYYVRGKVSGKVTYCTETIPLQVLSREESGCQYLFLPQSKTTQTGKNCCISFDGRCLWLFPAGKPSDQCKKSPGPLCKYFVTQPSSTSGGILCGWSGRRILRRITLPGYILQSLRADNDGGLFMRPPGKCLKIVCE